MRKFKFTEIYNKIIFTHWKKINQFKAQKYGNIFLYTIFIFKLLFITIKKT